MPIPDTAARTGVPTADVWGMNKTHAQIGRLASLAVLAGGICTNRVIADDGPIDLPTDGMELTSVLSGPDDLPGRVDGPRSTDEKRELPPANKPVPKPELAEGETEKPEDREWIGGKAWFEWSRVTGDWAGGRTWLEERGLTIAAGYETHWGTVVDGGLRNVASSRHLFDVNATADFEKMFGVKGGTFFVDAYVGTMRGGSRDVGDFQGVSNLEYGKNGGQVAEVWYEQKLLDEKLRLKLGKIDANSEFFFPTMGGYFLSSSPMLSPAHAATAAYPNPAMGAVAFWYPSDSFYVGGGFFDGATADGFETGNRGLDTFFSDDDSQSWNWSGEAGVTWKNLGSQAEWWGKGRVAVSCNYHTGEWATFDGGSQDGSLSLGLIAEQRIWGPVDEAGEQKDQGVYVFGQYGHGDCDVNAVEHQLGFGVVWLGPIASRSDDVVGAYVSFVDLSDEVGAGFAEDETSAEVFYQIQLTPAISLTPDLQYVWTPNGDPTIDDALVLQVRLTVDF